MNAQTIITALNIAEAVTLTAIPMVVTLALLGILAEPLGARLQGRFAVTGALALQALACTWLVH